MLNDLSGIKRNLCEREYTFDELPKEIMYMSEIDIELFELKMKVTSTRETKLLNYELDEIIIKLEDRYCENTIYTKSDTDKVIENQMEYQIC
jgi:hypothetical protein